MNVFSLSDFRLSLSITMIMVAKHAVYGYPMGANLFLWFNNKLATAPTTRTRAKAATTPAGSPFKKREFDTLASSLTGNPNYKSHTNHAH